MQILRIVRALGAPALAVSVCATVLAGTPVAADEPVDHALAELGAPYFERYCVSCHGARGRGDGPVSAVLLSPPANLTRIAARRGGLFPAGEIAQKIDGRFAVAAHGSREMPIWGEVFSQGIPESDSAESIARGKVLVLVEYLKSIQVPPLVAEPSTRP